MKFRYNIKYYIIMIYNYNNVREWKSFFVKLLFSIIFPMYLGYLLGRIVQPENSLHRIIFIFFLLLIIFLTYQLDKSYFRLINRKDLHFYSLLDYSILEYITCKELTVSSESKIIPFFFSVGMLFVDSSTSRIFLEIFILFFVVLMSLFCRIYLLLAFVNMRHATFILPVVKAIEILPYIITYIDIISAKKYISLLITAFLLVLILPMPVVLYKKGTSNDLSIFSKKLSQYTREKK